MEAPSAKTPYQVIARKYRPQTFSDVIGQDSIVTTLKNGIRYQRLAHAYLFCGCRGTGKTTLARVFSKALNCHRLTDDLEPCNICSSCLDISQGRSIDVMEIDGASHRGIDDIRQINETIGYAAAGKFKIYIIDEVHMLTKEAFNALLKTLEEPPANVKFFFATTEPHKVLPTIMSRCQRFDLNRITPELIQKKLERIAKDFSLSYEEEALQMIARLGEGSLRDAESLFDQVICYTEGPLTVEKVSSSLGLVSSSTFFELDEAMHNQDISYAFVLADKIFSSGKDLSHFVDCLMEHFRTLLSIHLRPSSTPTSGNLRKYTSSAAMYKQEQLLYILEYLLDWMQNVSKTTFKRISLEMILIHIIRSKNIVPIDAIVARLKELEGPNKEERSAAAPAEAPIPKAGGSSPEKEVGQPTPGQAPLLPKADMDKKPPAPLKEAESKNEPAPRTDEKQTILPSPASEAPSKAVEVAAQITPTPKPKTKYETLMRFAAVELEGVLTKELK